MTGEKHRFASLDALRGVAAFVVVLHHVMIARQEFWDAYTPEGAQTRAAKILSDTPLHLLWAGQEAVIVFFVLSGFVLSYPYWLGKKIELAPFLIRRFFRLYPAYLAAMLIAFVTLWATGGGPVSWGSQWTRGFWTAPPTLEQALKYLAMAVPTDLNTINSVIWTLIVEVHISILFIPILWAMRSVGILAVPLAAAAALGMRFLPEPPALIGITISYAWMFVLGAEIARQRDIVQRVLQKTGPVINGVLFVVALLAINSHWTFPSYRHSGMTLLFSWAAGSALLVCLIAFLPWKHKPPVFLQWMGRISYSLYLLHFIVIFALLHIAPPMPHYLFAALVILASVALSELLYRWVELPGIAAGKAIAHRLEARQK